MNFSDLFAISASGMNLERTRVEVATLNLANANTVAGGPGAVYRPLRVLASAGGSTSFASMVGAQAVGPEYVVEPTNLPPRKVYEPGHPLADAGGFVSYAGVDPAKEMTTLLSASRSYEANVAALNISRMMALKALDIGGNA